MYADLLIRIKPRTPFLTPIWADTLWGLLAWAYRYLYGADKLGEFIPSDDAPPPLLVSDAFPGDHLPRPLLPVTVEQVRHLLLAEGLQDGSPEYLQHVAAAKRWMEKTFLPREPIWEVLKGERSFMDLLKDGIAAEIQLSSPMQKQKKDEWIARVARRHNVIDRWRGGARDEDGLYTHQEQHYNGVWRIYLRTGFPPEVLRPLFEFIGQNGFGKRASTGCGQFELCEDFETHKLFAPPADANGFMTLASSYVAERPSDLDGAHYSFHIRRGKIGPLWGHHEMGDFLKRPLVLFKAGSLFRHAEPARAWQGKLLRQVHRNPKLPICHYGYAFPVACKF
jgi:CRISPR-associated protein Csm4